MGNTFAGKCDWVNSGAGSADKKEEKFRKLLVTEPKSIHLLFNFHAVFPSEFSVWKPNGKSVLCPVLIMIWTSSEGG